MNKAEYDLQQVQKQAIIQSAIDARLKKQALLENHTVVQNLLAEIVKQAAGWTTLDPWAQNALDSVKLGKTVDLVQLQSDINAWVSSRGGQ